MQETNEMCIVQFEWIADGNIEWSTQKIIHRKMKGVCIHWTGLLDWINGLD